MNIKNNHLVIMAGGVGSRFWPMSTPDYPKQFIDVLGCGRTLIQLTADRFQGICPPENIWVVTSETYADTVKEQLPDIADDHILREPCRRNTAPCIAYVSWKIKARNPKANMVVTPSDHIVMNIAEFQRVINSAMNFPGPEYGPLPTYAACLPHPLPLCTRVHRNLLSHGSEQPDYRFHRAVQPE